MIHALDPVFIVEKVAQCAFYKVLPIEVALENTITKFNGLGGYEILGKCRKGGPVVVDKQKVEEKETTSQTKGRTMDPANMTSEEIQKELARPLFKDSKKDFESKIKSYIDSHPSL